MHPDWKVTFYMHSPCGSNTVWLFRLHTWKPSIPCSVFLHSTDLSFLLCFHSILVSILTSWFSVSRHHTTAVALGSSLSHPHILCHLLLHISVFISLLGAAFEPSALFQIQTIFHNNNFVHLCIANMKFACKAPQSSKVKVSEAMTLEYKDGCA